MDLKDIASVSGKPGLFKIIKPTRTGVILESLDAQKTKLIANANSKVSILKEISIYTTGKETNKPLDEILLLLEQKFGNEITIDTKTAENYELKDFLLKVVPDFDQEKVYASDIKKLIVWYNILQNYCPEVFETLKKSTAEAEKAENEVEAVVEEAKVEKAEKKVAKTKAKDSNTASNVNTKIKATKNTSTKNVTKNTPSKRGV